MQKILLLLIIPLLSFSQTNEEQILLIKEMYKETKKLLSSSKNNCRSITFYEYEDPDDEYSRPYTRDVTYCNVGNGYSRITCDFSGDHDFETAEYYFKYNYLYFYYGTYSYVVDEEKTIKYRQYFNPSGQMIRNLENSGTGNKDVVSGEPYLDLLHKAQGALIK